MFSKEDIAEANRYSKLCTLASILNKYPHLSDAVSKVSFSDNACAAHYITVIHFRLYNLNGLTILSMQPMKNILDLCLS
jgi:hypothetical protein